MPDPLKRCIGCAGLAAILAANVACIWTCLANLDATGGSTLFEVAWTWGLILVFFASLALGLAVFVCIPLVVFDLVALVYCWCWHAAFHKDTSNPKLEETDDVYA